MGRHGTIAGRKEAQDKKRAASFTKLVRLITVAARGGENPEFNVALKHAIEKAKAINMPNDNINRAIKKGAGTDGSTAFETLNYEGYGPAGVAIIVEALTDNKNRTASSVKNSVMGTNSSINIYNKDVANSFKTQYYKDIAISKKLTFADFKKRSIFTKIKESVFRLLSPVL